MLKTKPSAFVFCVIVFLVLQELIGIIQTAAFIGSITLLYFWYREFIR